jgi:hypothetical protein
VRASALILDPLVESNRKLKTELQEARRAAADAKSEMHTNLERMRIEHEQRLLEREDAVLRKEEERIHASEKERRVKRVEEEAELLRRSSGKASRPFATATGDGNDHFSPPQQQQQQQSHRARAATDYRHSSTVPLMNIELSPQQQHLVAAVPAVPVPTDDPQVDEMLQSLFSAKRELLRRV